MKNSTRKILFAAVLSAMPLFAADTEVQKKPNIILILADDLGIGNVKVYGADHFKTPNIDKLAAGGIRFEHCYSEPLCGPSRAKILTGRFNFRTGMTSNDPPPFMKPSNEILMCTTLHNAGYVTASVGKWSQLPLEPADWGFDQYLTFPGSGIYWAGQKKGGKRWDGNYTENRVKKILPQNVYMPDVMSRFAIDFITNATKDHKPFFLYYPMSHIHDPILKTPDSAPNASPNQLYQDNVAYMDKLVGELVGAVKGLKIENNTLIIFTGDNGTMHVYRTFCTVDGGKQLSGCKGTMLEGGAHVPMIANWPGTTPAGRISNDLVDSTDFFTTFTELAGGKLPSDRVMDGVSFTNLLHGKPFKNPRQWIFVLLGPEWYDENLKWKIHEDGTLNDMSNAPFTEPVVTKSNTNPEVIAAARNSLQKVLDELNPKAGKVGVDNEKQRKFIQQRTRDAESGVSSPDESQPGE